MTRLRGIFTKHAVNECKYFTTAQDTISKFMVVFNKTVDVNEHSHSSTDLHEVPLN